MTTEWEKMRGDVFAKELLDLAEKLKTARTALANIRLTIQDRQTSDADKLTAIALKVRDTLDQTKTP